MTDPSTRGDAEEALRREQDRYRSLVRASAQVVWTTDPEGRVAEDSPSWRAFTGQTVEEWLGWGWLDAVHPDDRASARAAWSNAVALRIPYETEYRLRTALGGYRLTVARGVPVLGPDGRIREWVGMNTDVTAERAAQQALRAGEERWRALTDGMPQLVWACRPDGSVDFVNRQWQEYTGQEPAQARGAGWVGALHREDRAATAEAWRQAVAAGGEFEARCRIRRARDGSYRWHLARAWPQRDAGGRVVQWFGTCTHIDAEVRAEEALQDADRRKDQWLAMLAHELRNPLAPVRNALAVLQAARGDAHVGDKARAILERQVGHLARLVDDLLDVSRISRGKIRLRRERLDLVRLVETSAEDRRSAVEAAGLTLELELPPEPLWLQADPTRLAQVLDNLLSNATKFTERGGRLTVRVRREGDGWAAVTVEDTGTGIEPEMLGRIWDTFSQADRSLDRSRGGLGLGLALVKGLVELHGGRAEASSAGPGRGAAFMFRLPLEEAAASASPAGPPATPAAGVRVLLIEDNVDSATTLRMLLSLSGHEVAEAHSGPAGLEAARQFRPDVVLCDIGLPGMDGFAVGRALRAEPSLAGTYLVALTGYGQPDDRQKSRAAGFDEHLVKPVEPADLQRVLASRRQPR